AIDDRLRGEAPPRLLVYVPADRARCHSALAELEAAGVVLQPGQQPPTRNTRLAVVARNALRPVLGEDSATAIERQVEGGKLTLAELDSLAEQGEGISKGVVSVVFGSPNPPEVALAFLSSDRLDAELGRKSGQAELAALLGRAFEVELP